MDTSNLERVVTKGSSLKEDSGTFEAVTFTEKKRKVKQKEINPIVSSSNTKAKNIEIDLKKAKYEVLRFGSSGLDPVKKEESKIAIAVSLGAVPPKRKAINYKELLEIKRENLRKEQEQRKLYLSSHKKTKTKGKYQNNPRKQLLPGRKDSSSNLLKLYGKVAKQERLKPVAEQGRGKGKKHR